jgi:uncharacterized membrane protein (UPF0136 family)
MFNKRLKISIISGIILGVICIIGSGIRIGSDVKALYLAGLFYNRFLMGVVFGFFVDKNGVKVLIRGAIIGFLISFAFYLSTEFQDVISLIAGVAYGIIIDAIASRYFYKMKNWFRS